MMGVLSAGTYRILRPRRCLSYLHEPLPARAIRGRRDPSCDSTRLCELEVDYQLATALESRLREGVGLANLSDN